MRKFTNEYHLPPPLFNALTNDKYVGGGDISITRLIAPPRQVVLRKFHEDEIVEDAADRIWSLLGSSVHYMIELAAEGDKKAVVESRLHMPIEGIVNDGKKMVWQLSGQPDLNYDGHIYDWKVTSIWSANKIKPEWEQQVNLQAMLHRFKGDKITGVSIIPILRDWQVSKSKFQRDYPPKAVKPLSFPLWSQEQAIHFAQERMKLHQAAFLDYNENKDANRITLCSDEERWYSGTGYAVKKLNEKTGKVNLRADKVFVRKEAAMSYMQEQAPFLPRNRRWAPLEERPGRNVKCLSYCDVWAQCPFGRSLKAKELEEIKDTQDKEAVKDLIEEVEGDSEE